MLATPSVTMERDTGDNGRSSAGRPEIDTRPPFRSVREAVALFGEKVLAGEIYANKLIKEIRTAKAMTVGSQSRSPRSRIGALTAELEKTRQTLSRTLQDNTIMSKRIQTLKEELESAKREIQLLRERVLEPTFHSIEDPEIEELKFVEQRQTMNRILSYKTDDCVEKEQEIVEEFEKRRLVRFASPPLLTRVMMSVVEEDKKEEMEKEKKVLERPPSVKEKKVLDGSPPSNKQTKKKKSFVPFMGWFVS